MCDIRRQNSRRDTLSRNDASIVIVTARSRSRSMKIVDAGEATRTDAEARFTDVCMDVCVRTDRRTDVRTDGSPTSHHPQLASDWFHHSRIMCCCGIPRWGLSLLPPESPDSHRCEAWLLTGMHRAARSLARSRLNRGWRIPFGEPPSEFDIYPRESSIFAS